MRCQRCEIWEILPEDVYCSYCGEKLVGFELELSPERIYRDNDSELGQIELCITNKGQSSLQIEDIRAEPAFVDVEGKTTHLAELASGEEHHVPLQLNWKNLADEPVQCKVWVNTSVGEESKGFEVLPLPDFKIEAPSTEVSILVGAGDDINPPIECSIEVTKGKVMLQEGDITISGIPEASIQLECEFPIELDATTDRNTTPISIVINSEGLEAGKEYTGALKVVSRESGVEADKSFTIRTTRAPEIVIASAINYRDGRIIGTAFAEREGEFSLTIHNPGGVDFTIAQVEVETPQNLVRCVSEPSITVKAESGEDVTLTFKVDAQNLAAGDSINGTVSIFTNYSWLQTEIPLEITVEEMEEYEYFVAVDFGNTNCSCAIADSENPQQVQLVPLVEVAEQRHRILAETIIPSVIYYRNISEDRVDYIVGQAAKDYTTHPDYSKSTVESIKRLLGRVEFIEVQINGQKRKLRPEEIAGHIIKYILDKTELRLKKKITKCIVTHPAAFFQKQIDALKQAFINYGIEQNNLKLLSESTAAVFNYIINRQEGPLEYTILVYDCGGSTTDVTLLEVKDTEENVIPRRIKPKVLGVDGRRLGGDDITNWLAELILERCKEIHKDSEIPFEPMDYERNLQLFEVAYTNKVEIFYAAEQTKILLSDYQTVLFGERSNSDDALEQEGGGEIILQLPITLLDAGHQQETVTVSGLEISRVDLEELIEQAVDETIEMAKDVVEAAGIVMPDVVVPAGLSCNIPLIKKKLEEAFGEDNIYWFDDLNKLKECVASGAYFRYALASGFSEIIVEDEDIKPLTTSRFGIRVTNRRGQYEFREIIAKGMQIPVERNINVPVQGRTVRVVVCENAGKENEFIINGKRNENIQIIGESELRIPDDVPDSELESCEVTMKITEDLNLELNTPWGSMETKWQPIY